MASSSSIARRKTLPVLLKSLLSSSNMSGLSSRIVQLLPTLAKYLLYLLVFVNARSFPLVWHWRVFWPVTRIRIQYRLFRLSLAFKTRSLKAALDAKWWEAAAPVGANPLESMVKYTTWASVDDSDFNIHLSNSSYAKALDSARFHGAMKWFPLFFKNGGWSPLAATHYHFIREIPMFSKYEIRVRIGSWDDKWMYLVCRFVTKPKKGSSVKKPNKIVITPPTTTQTPPADNDAFISVRSMHTPATDSELNTSVSPTPIPSTTPHPPPNANIIDSLLHKQEQIEEPDGAILHTTTVSQVCFKFGRITVPPAIVMALNGFTGPPLADSKGVTGAAYSRTNPPPHWSIVQSLVFPAHGGSTKKVQALFKGGWKDVPAEQRWWETCFSGAIEEGRKERLVGLQGIRQGTEAVRGLSLL
ncbi:hypothetical protein ONZ45_g1417 [Pleurotus djamor]|nr:hypothetical protein ONZ45_g1417 [Pleurotus djamor]